MKELSEYSLDELWSLLGFILRVEVMSENNVMTTGIDREHLKLWHERVNQACLDSIDRKIESESSLRNFNKS